MPNLDLASEIEEALTVHAVGACSAYRNIVDKAVDMEMPPYTMSSYFEEYQKQACDPFWLASSLLSNSVREADGAKQLFKFINKIPTELSEVSKAVVGHAIDETGHARTFIRLLRLAFPNAEISEELMAEIEANQPSVNISATEPTEKKYTVNQTLDELAQINIGEIRTRINQLLLAPMLIAHAPSENRHLVEAIMSKLLRDEQQHIAYTAGILNSFCESTSHGDWVQKIYLHRFQRFNQKTICDLRGIDFAI